MKSLISCELYRIWNSRKNRILFIIGIILFILNGLFLKYSPIGFYDKVSSISLDSLNFPPFILRENHLFIVFIFCPMLFSEIFNHERTSGAYRLILIRGYNKSKCILSKILSCSIVAGIYIGVLFIIGTILGYTFAENISSTSFFNEKSFTLLESMVYNFKFYFLEYLVILTIIGLTSLIANFMANSAITYALTVGICVALIYIKNSIFEFLLVNSKTFFDVLDGRSSTFLCVSILGIIITYSLSTIIFKNKDYLN